MADEELAFSLLVRDRNASRTLKNVGDAATKTGSDFDKAGKGAGKLGEGFDKAGESAGKAGEDFDKAGDGAGKLAAEIDETTLRLKELGEEFDRTGDKSLLKDIGKERRTLAGLTKLRTEMAGLADAAGDVGKASSKGFLDALGVLPSQLKGAAIVGLTGAAAAAAPAIGAIVGGAVLAGVGSAGIGAGVALAFQDPRVSNAASDLGMRVKNAFVDAADGMVGPTIEALGVLGDAAVDVAGQMGGVFDALAPEVVPLAEAIGDMARNAMPGFREAIEAARPALRVLAEQLPEIGDAFSDMFSTISDEGDGAILGLLALFDLAEGAIRITGDTIAWLSARFEDFVRVVAKISGEAEDLWGWIPGVGDRIRSTNDRTEEWLKQLEASKGPAGTARSAFGEVGDAAEDAGKAAEKAARHFEDMFSQWMGVDESAIAVRDAIRDVAESLDENGNAFGDNSEAADANAEAFLRAVGAAEQHRQKMIQSGQSIPYANKVFQETVDKLYAEGIAAGIARGQLDALLGKYRDLANAPNITKTITYQQVFTQHGQVFQPSGGGHQFFAEGGPVSGSGPKGVDSVPAMLAPGEFVLNSRAVDRIGMANLSRINRDAGVAAMSATAAPSMGGGGVGPLVFNYSGGGSGLEDMFVSWMHRSIREGRIQLTAGGSKVKVGG